MTTAPLDGVRVLVVEDDPDILRMIETVLRGVGAEVAGVDSGETARASLEERRFDAVVLDWNLTDVTGSSFIDHLRDRTPSLVDRTLVITGDLVRRGSEHEAARMGCRVLAKPFRPPALVAAVLALVR